MLYASIALAIVWQWPSFVPFESMTFAKKALAEETLSKAFAAPVPSPTLESAKHRSEWTKSIVVNLPDQPWQTIANDGSTSASSSIQNGTTLLTSIDSAGKRWLVAINSMPWTEQLEIHWSQAPAVESTEPKSDIEQSDIKQSRVEATPNVPQHNSWQFSLPAMSIRKWTWSNKDSIVLLNWSHTTSQEGIDLMNDQVASISETIQRMTNFRTDFGFQLDGSFDSTNVQQLRHSPGSSTTWLLSMNPTVTWSNSTIPVRSSGQSLQYESAYENGSGWIQTKAIPRRVTWPLAVEVWIRVEDQSHRPRVRLITSGTLDNTKLSEAKEIAEIKQNDGATDLWTRYEFPTLRNNAAKDSKSATHPVAVSPSEMLQWTIEVSGPGRLWIDDIGMSPLVLSEEERRLLRSQLFVAKRELAQRQPLKALEWIESPLVAQILQVSHQCPADFLKPIIRTAKPVATTKRSSFLQSTRTWFWKPKPSDLEPGKVRLSKGNPIIPTLPLNR